MESPESVSLFMPSGLASSAFHSSGIRDVRTVVGVRWGRVWCHFLHLLRDVPL